MKKTIYMIFLIAVACVLGNLLGNLVFATEGLSWLAFSLPFNFSPATFNFFNVFDVTFGFNFNLNVSQIILIIVGIIVYAKTSPKLFAK